MLDPWNFIGDGELGTILFLGDHRRTMLSVCLDHHGIAASDLGVEMEVLLVGFVVASFPDPSLVGIEGSLKI